MIAQTLPQFQPRGLVYNNDHLVFKNTYDSNESWIWIYEMVGLLASPPLKILIKFLEKKTINFLEKFIIY